MPLNGKTPKEWDNNCGLVAISDVTTLNVNEAAEAYQEEDKSVRGPRWRGLTKLAAVYSTLRKLRIKFSIIPIKKEVMLRNWAEMHAKPNTIYLVRTGGHLQTVLDGISFDQEGAHDLKTSWQGRKRITHAIKIIT